jgi:hypothetical protein
MLLTHYNILYYFSKTLSEMHYYAFTPIQYIILFFKNHIYNIKDTFDRVILSKTFMKQTKQQRHFSFCTNTFWL